MTLVTLLLKNKSDVICLQEVLSELVDWFIAELSDEYTHVMSELHPWGRPYGELIFIKKGINLLSFACTDLDGKMCRALQHAVIEKDNVVYNVLTFHLESMNCKKVRRAQLATLWEHVSDLSNVICCGDTNQTAKEECVIPDNFLDAWAESRSDMGEYTYYSGRFWDGDRKQRYDKIWYSDLQLHAFGVLGNKPFLGGNIWISDHDGLYCLFSLTGSCTSRGSLIRHEGKRVAFP